MTEGRILIAGDDPLARAGLVTLLDAWDVVGQVSLTPDDERLLDVYRPDVLLWDLGWDPDAARLADFADDGPPIVALLPDAEQADAAWQAGVRGLLLRSVSAEQLVAALRGVLAGLVVCDPELATALPATRPLPPPTVLTPREIDVLRLLTEGLANRAIAQQLAISEHTVKFHINAILSKLGAQSRTEAVVSAIRLGLIAL